MNTEAALSTIAEVAGDSPDAVLLARLASPAIRIEPHLLRLLRTSLLPEADVSAEADLWFSPLVESAGADSIVLDAGIAEVLRSDLANERELLEETTSLIRDAHAHLPPALRLEEEVTALALFGADDAADRIDAALATALRALTADAARARETARWFARAWPRLPAAVRRTRGAATLALAAGLLGGRRGPTAPVDANASIDDVRWVFREQSFTDFDNVDAFMEGDTVVFTEAGASGGMRVPRTDPRVVELSFGDQNAHEPLLVDASPGTAVSLPPDVTRVTLTTLAGDVYELERIAAEESETVHATAPPAGSTDAAQTVEAREAAGSTQDAEQAVSPETVPATGNRIAKIVIVAMDPGMAGEAVRSLSDRVIGSTELPRKGVSWNVTVRDSSDLRAGVIFHAARVDPEWPLVLDLRDAALVVLEDDLIGSPPVKREPDDDAEWPEHVRSVVAHAAPHVPVISSSQLTGLTGQRFPSSDPILRETLFGMIDWAAQPELDAETWESAPQLALQPPTSGPVGHARELFSQVGGWDAEIDRWLGILTGGRVVESSDIVFRDPAWFEEIVIAIVRAIDEEQKTRGIPGIDLFHVERLLTAQRLLDQARLPVATQSVVYAAATVLRDAGLAVLINTDYGSVVTMPGRAWDGSGVYRPGQGDRVMSASWTGDNSTGFFAVVSAFEWSDGRVEEVGWHSQIAEGVAWVERDGRYRIEARQNGQIADLVVTEEEEAPGYADRPLRMIRSALEEALADNRSLSIREERMLA